MSPLDPVTGIPPDPMKVAVVTQYFPTSVQPWAGHSAYQTLRLLARRCNLHVFYPQARYPALLRPATALSKPLDPDWNPPDVNVTYLPYPVLPMVTRPLNGFLMERRLRKAVLAWKPDVVISYVVYPDGLAAVRLARQLGVPSLVTAIGSDLNRMPDALCAALTRWTLRQADFVTTVSHDLCRTARRLGADEDRSRAKLNGCDTSNFYPRDRAQARRQLGIPEDQEVIVYVGRLDVKKGLIELVEAIAELRRQRPHAHCYLIGDGSDKPLVLAAIERTHTAGNITFIPSCPTQQIAVWFGAANLSTLPSYREGCPNVVVESLASGRPVVATSVGGIPELMDASVGRLVPSHNVPALTAALNETLDTAWDEDFIAHRHARSWDTVAEELYRTLKEMLARGLRHPTQT